jgi:LCP family protein required for cell wall assembly
VLVGGEPGPWGPPARGGSRHRRLRRLLSVLGVLALVLVSAGATTGYLLYRQADANLTRVAVGSLEEVGSPSDARHFLVVGSDDRAGLSRQEQRELTLGTEEQFSGQRSDTMIYATISADRSQVALISIPRDLVVEREDGSLTKVTNVFTGGPEPVVEALRRTYGLPVNHYAKVSLGGFLDVVDTLGGVTIELEEPLVDRKSGAQFTEPGVYEMDPAEALSYVRSRQGTHGDYERIERQQTFIKAVLSELVETGNLTNPVRLLRLVDDITSSVTTDEGLGLQEARYLADDLRTVVSGGVPMRTFPSYAAELSGSSALPRGSYVLPYEPGAKALAEAVASGDPLPETASREEAADIAVAMVPGQNRQAMDAALGPTLVYANFDVRTWSSAPERVHATTRTTVFSRPGKTTEAGWLAAYLGAELRPLPEGVDAPPGTDVVVAVGADAGGVSTSSPTTTNSPTTTAEGP